MTLARPNRSSHRARTHWGRIGGLALAGWLALATASAAVPEPQPPEVRIVEPLNGSTHPTGDIRIRAEASDSDGYVYRVDFLVDLETLAIDQMAPFQTTWDDAPHGRYALKAIAYDNSGRRRVSDPVHIQVGEDHIDQLRRGPYLQLATPTSMTVRWRTDWFTPGIVRYRQASATDWFTVTNHVPSIDHEVRLDGLMPDTVYDYEIATPSRVLANGAKLNFKTSPTNSPATRIWVIGDSGTADENARKVFTSYLNYGASRRTDVWLMLGDNAYEIGTDDQYQVSVFDFYGELLSQAVLWPTIGNHDIGLAGPGDLPFLDIFTLPTQGEAGGLPSGTERYHSFDYGNIHFVCLDSQTSDRTPGGAMLTWLDEDLAATTKDWVIAYWHHPPYTKGTHDSDLESQLIEMRENALPILERHGTDLVLCGHSHVYERSFLLNGHYGFSMSLTESMVLDASSGRLDHGNPYRKPAGGLGARQGCVYAVCGCSGQGGYFEFGLHPAMFTHYAGFGSMVIDVKGLILDARFLNEANQVMDGFSIVKEGNPTEPSLTIRRTEDPLQLRISWPTSEYLYDVEALDPLDPSWEMNQVTNEVTTFGREHGVLVPCLPEARWFRLHRRASGGAGSDLTM